MTLWTPLWRLLAELSERRDRHMVAPARTKQRAQLPSEQVKIPEVRQLLVDVSIISQNDAQTGIQRVVRALVTQLLSNHAPAGYIVRTVAATRKMPYRIINWPNKADSKHGSQEVNIQPGDIFLGLDLCTRIVHAQQKQLSEWQRSGASLNFVVYDLLPLQNRRWFTDKTIFYFQRWLRTLAVLADQIICISPQVASEFNNYTMDRYRLPKHWVPIQTIPMGHDIAASQPSRGLPHDFDQTLEKIRCQGAVLMVGTLEPRKGHEQVLNAFEHLWQIGMNYSLVLVGRSGWKTKALQRRLKKHPELNNKLFWLDEASDEALDLVYHACQGVLIASWAEGFGLPLIEALGYGKPILVRNLPVFHELNSSSITYFDTTNSEKLANITQEWISKLKENDNLQQSNSLVSSCTWRQTAQSLLNILSIRHNNSINGAHS